MFEISHVPELPSLKEIAIGTNASLVSEAQEVRVINVKIKKGASASFAPHSHQFIIIKLYLTHTGCASIVGMMVVGMRRIGLLHIAATAP